MTWLLNNHVYENDTDFFSSIWSNHHAKSRLAFGFCINLFVKIIRSILWSSFLCKPAIIAYFVLRNWILGIVWTITNYHWLQLKSFKLFAHACPFLCTHMEVFHYALSTPLHMLWATQLWIKQKSVDSYLPHDQFSYQYRYGCSFIFL